MAESSAATGRTDIARLILVNGAPGVGKSTLAGRYVDDHPLALNLDIDSLRCAMGRWETHDESKSLARALAVEMARVHLGAGHDVVVPQLVARIEFVEALERAAREAGAEFCEILLRATVADTVPRVQDRRAAMEAAAAAHPQRSVDLGSDRIAAIIEELEQVARRRPRTRVIDAAGDVEAAYAALCVAIGTTQR